MASSRYHNIVTGKEYARLHGISERTARRRLAKDSNAINTGKGYKVAIPSTTYAKLAGISPATARRRGTSNSDPLGTITASIPAASVTGLTRHLLGVLGGRTKKAVNPDTVRDGVRKMTNAQRREASRIVSYEDYIYEMGDGQFVDDEGQNLLWYK